MTSLKNSILAGTIAFGAAACARNAPVQTAAEIARAPENAPATETKATPAVETKSAAQEQPAPTAVNNGFGVECSTDGAFTYQFKAAGLVKGALTLTRDAKTQDILIANAAGDIVDAGCKFYLIAPLNITYNPATNGLSYDGNAPAAQMTLKDSFSTQVNGHIFASAGKDALSYTNTASAARFKVSFTAGQAYTVTPK